MILSGSVTVLKNLLRHLTPLFFSTALGNKVRTKNKEKLIRSLAKVYNLPEKQVRKDLRNLDIFLEQKHSS